MRSLAIPKYCTPDNYEIIDLPVPAITSPDHVQIRVHAASINPVDVKLASGLAKMFETAKFVLIDIRGLYFSHKFDTLGGVISYVSLIKPNAGRIITIASIPDGAAVKEAFPDTPFYIPYVLDFMDWYYRFRAGRWNVGYEYYTVKVETEDLDIMSKFVAEGKVKPVVGRVAKLDDLYAVKEGCNEIYKAHGGIGKFVIELV